MIQRSSSSSRICRRSTASEVQRPTIRGMSSQKVRRVVHTRQTRPREFASCAARDVAREQNRPRLAAGHFVRIQLRIPTVGTIGRWPLARYDVAILVYSLHPRVKGTVDPIMQSDICGRSHPPASPISPVLDNFLDFECGRVFRLAFP